MSFKTMEICLFLYIFLTVNQYYFPIFLMVGECYFKKDIFRHTTEHINIFDYSLLLINSFCPGFLFLKQAILVGN